jgi:hypothetical protein
VTPVTERPRLERVLERLQQLRNPSGAIYGTLVAAAVLAGESNTHDGLVEMAGVVLTTVVVYWLAHGYAEMLPQRARHDAQGLPVSIVRDLWGALRAEWPIVGGSFALIFVLLLAGSLGAGTGTAINVALWFASAELLLWGALAARAARLNGWTIVGYAAGSAALGVIIATLKVRLH